MLILKGLLALALLSAGLSGCTDKETKLKMTALDHQVSQLSSQVQQMDQQLSSLESDVGRIRNQMDTMHAPVGKKTTAKIAPSHPAKATASQHKTTSHLKKNNKSKMHSISSKTKKKSSSKNNRYR